MKNTMQNPIINLGALTGEAREIATRIVNSKTGRLLASKPNVQYFKLHQADGRMIHEPERTSGEAAYVWRMVAFQIGTRPADHCMPCTADFSVPGNHADRRARVAELDVVVDAIVNTVPKAEWHGINRWGNAFGLTGQPQVAADGAIIYR